MKIFSSLRHGFESLFLVLGLAASLPVGAVAPGSPGTVSTVAGFGIFDRANVDINLVSPGLMTTDGFGYVYFPDQGNNVVYSRDPWEIVDQLAGDGIAGFSGDFGRADQARLNNPGGVATTDASLATDADAAIYIADTGNHRIRKVVKREVTKGTFLNFISTVAGDGTAAFKGDDGPAIQAGFMSPEALVLDAKGTLYIADRLDHRVRKIATDGVITTLAGTGQPGFSGDGGLAAQAQLNEPNALAVDGQGNVYISDSNNARIRIVTPDGKIATYIGGGTHGEDGVSGTDAALTHPYGLALNGDGFYFVDGLRVRALVQGKVRTVAGNGKDGWSGDDDSPLNASFRHPVGLALPIFESLLITDDIERRMRRVTFLDFTRNDPGTVTTAIGNELFDDTPAQSGKITLPRAVVGFPDGRMLIADYGNRRVRSVERSQSPRPIRTTNFSNLPGFLVKLKTASDPLSQFLHDHLRPETKTFLSGYDPAVPPSDDAGRAQLSSSTAALLDDLDSVLRSVPLYDATRFASIPLMQGTQDLIARNPGPGNTLFRLNRFLMEEAYPQQIKPSTFNLYTVAGGGETPPAEGLKATDADLAPVTGVIGKIGGPYYFSEGEKGRVWQVDDSGLLHPVAIPDLQYPEGLAQTGDGRLLVADRDAGKVWALDSSGTASVFAGTGPGDSGDNGPAILAQLNAPSAVAPAPNGAVYIADTGNHKIRRVDPDGTIHTVTGNGSAGPSQEGPAAASALGDPTGVAVDGDGTLYLSDSLSHRLLRVKPEGNLEIIGGCPDPGSPEKDSLTGSDSPYQSGFTPFYEPAGLNFDGSGNLYIADEHNHRIRVLWNASRARSLTPALLPGDVNGDGQVNVGDVIQALRIAVRLLNPTDDQAQAADVSPHPGLCGQPYGDGQVDTSDAIRLLTRAAGAIPDAQWP